MSIAYDTYINIHRKYVTCALCWIQNNLSIKEVEKCLPNLLSDYMIDPFIFDNHDESKFTPEEYDAYDQYFYNNGYSTEEGKLNFRKAFLHHIHMNPHHWQHWVLIDDESDDLIDGHQLGAIDIPDNFILEMICDWWSFSWRKALELADDKSLYGVFDWYDDHKKTMVLSENTRIKVEKLLEMIKNQLPFSDTISYTMKYK